MVKILSGSGTLAGLFCCLTISVFYSLSQLLFQMVPITNHISLQPTAYFTSRVELKLLRDSCMPYNNTYIILCLTRRTCHSGGCPVEQIWRLWLMHWSWITSRGHQLSTSALRARRSSVVQPENKDACGNWLQISIAVQSEHLSRQFNTRMLCGLSSSATAGHRHETTSADVQLCKVQIRDQIIANPRELRLVLQVLNICI